MINRIMTKLPLPQVNCSKCCSICVWHKYEGNCQEWLECTICHTTWVWSEIDKKMIEQVKPEKTVIISLNLLERLWDKLTDDVYDRGIDGDTWQSEELSKLIAELEDILRENSSEILVK